MDKFEHCVCVGEGGTSAHVFSGKKHVIDFMDRDKDRRLNVNYVSPWKGLETY